MSFSDTSPLRHLTPHSSTRLTVTRPLVALPLVALPPVALPSVALPLVALPPVALPLVALPPVALSPVTLSSIYRCPFCFYRAFFAPPSLSYSNAINNNYNYSQSELINYSHSELLLCTYRHHIVAFATSPAILQHYQQPPECTQPKPIHISINSARSWLLDDGGAVQAPPPWSALDSKPDTSALTPKGVGRWITVVPPRLYWSALTQKPRPSASTPQGVDGWKQTPSASTPEGVGCWATVVPLLAPLA